MSSGEFQISDYNRIIFKQFRFIFIIVMLATIIGLSIGYGISRHYKSTSIIQADFDLFFEGAQVESWLKDDLQENLGSMIVDMNSYTILLKVVQKIGWVSDTVDVEEVMQDQGVLTEIEKVREMITLKPVAAEKQIEIIVKSKYPNEAAVIANALGITYRDFAYQNKREYFSKQEQRILENLMRCRNGLNELGERIIDARVQRQGELIDKEFHKKQEKKSELTELKARQINYLLSIVDAQRNELIHVRERLDASQKHQMEGGSNRDTIDNLPDLNWIAELSYRDPGIRVLNKRLVELRDLRTGYLHFYRAGHPSIISFNKQLLTTINELLIALDNTNKSLKNDSAEIAARNETISAALQRQPKDENVLEWMNRSYQVQEETCETIEVELTDIRLLIEGLVPYVHIVKDAEKPRSPMGLTTKKSGLIGMVAGVLLGIFLSIFREMADRSFSTVEEVRRVLTERPVLAVIPNVKFGKRSQRFTRESITVFRQYYKKLLPLLFDASSPVSDAYRLLAAQLSLQNTRKECAVILITSTINQEGKTFVAANLSLALALQGYQTTLIEADFRRPAIAPLLGLPQLPGLFELLVEAKKLDACRLTVTDLILGAFPLNEIVSIHGLNNFTLIPFGAFPPNPVELFDSEQMANLIDGMRMDCDYIIIDSPPVTNISDPVVLARYCNGIIMVYRSGKAPRELLQKSIRILDNTGVPILGLVLNDWHNPDGDIS